MDLVDVDKLLDELEASEEPAVVVHPPPIRPSTVSELSSLVSNIIFPNISKLVSEPSIPVQGSSVSRSAGGPSFENSVLHFTTNPSALSFPTPEREIANPILTISSSCCCSSNPPNFLSAQQSTCVCSTIPELVVSGSASLPAKEIGVSAGILEPLPFSAYNCSIFAQQKPFETPSDNAPFGQPTDSLPTTTTTTTTTTIVEPVSNDVDARVLVETTMQCGLNPDDRLAVNGSASTSDSLTAVKPFIPSTEASLNGVTEGSHVFVGEVERNCGDAPQSIQLDATTTVKPIQSGNTESDDESDVYVNLVLPTIHTDSHHQPVPVPSTFTIAPPIIQNDDHAIMNMDSPRSSHSITSEDSYHQSVPSTFSVTPHTIQNNDQVIENMVVSDSPRSSHSITSEGDISQSRTFADDLRLFTTGNGISQLSLNSPSFPRSVYDETPPNVDLTKLHLAMSMPNPLLTGAAPTSTTIADDKFNYRDYYDFTSTSSSGSSSALVSPVPADLASGHTPINANSNLETLLSVVSSIDGPSACEPVANKMISDGETMVDVKPENDNEPVVCVPVKLDSTNNDDSVPPPSVVCDTLVEISQLNGTVGNTMATPGSSLADVESRSVHVNPAYAKIQSENAAKTTRKQLDALLAQEAVFADLNLEQELEQLLAEGNIVPSSSADDVDEDTMGEATHGYDIVPSLSSEIAGGSSGVINTDFDDLSEPGETVTVVTTTSTDRLMPPETDLDTTSSLVESVPVYNNPPNSLIASTHDLGAASVPILTESERQLGIVAPIWIEDNDSKICMLCLSKFNFYKRRHHCRACGRVLCGECCHFKAILPYMDPPRETRVCRPCIDTLKRIQDREDSTVATSDDVETGDAGSVASGSTAEMGSSESRVAVTGATNQGLLKRPDDLQSDKGQSSSSLRKKQVSFSDGVKPGGDLRETDSSGVSTPSAYPPPLPASKVLGSSRRSRRDKENQALGVKQRELECFLPDAKKISDTVTYNLPPIVSKKEKSIRANEELANWLISSQQSEISFVVKRNLRVIVRLATLDCCVKRQCWCFVSRGLLSVGQDEIIIMVQRSTDESLIPVEIIKIINYLYDEAHKGNTVGDCEHLIVPESLFTGGKFLGSSDNRGFIFAQSSFQCLQNIVLPKSPYLIGILIQKWELSWAKVFPQRLLLRLGVEYKSYPFPVISVRDRPPMYYEVGHTIISLLADMRSFAFTLPYLKGASIHLEDDRTILLLPNERFNTMLKILAVSNERVIRFSVGISLEADSQLVCVQDPESGLYETQANNMIAANKDRKITAASFVVFNGSLKPGPNGHGEVKSTIVEDGIMIQVLSSYIDTLRDKLRNQEDTELECSDDAGNKTGVVSIKWVAETKRATSGLKSEIDNSSLENAHILRFQGRTVDMHTDNRLLRMSEVYILETDEPKVLTDSQNLHKLCRTLATAAFVALLPKVDQLIEAGFTTMALRVSLGPSGAQYTLGSGGEEMPTMYLTALDESLMPVLYSQMAQVPFNLKIELSFRLLYLW